MEPRNGGIMPCNVESCRYPTRTFRALATQYPFPTRRRRRGMCDKCYYQARPKPPTKERPAKSETAHPDTLAALDTFLAARRAREARAARIEQAWRT